MTLSAKIKTITVTFFIAFLAIFTSPLVAQNTSQLLEQSKRHFQYTQASQYTHVIWPTQAAGISVSLLPTINYSGIPIEHREADKDYFEHGKIPAQTFSLFADLLVASRYFNVTTNNASEYQLQLSIEKYEHPYQYSPDDQWWQKASDNLERAFASRKPASVKLSLSLTRGHFPIKAWQDTVEMTLTQCDLNNKPQAATWVNNQNKLQNDYRHSTLGQAYIAASNFLIAKAIERLNQESQFATLTQIDGNELMLSAKKQNFIVGKKLAVYPKKQDGRISTTPAGQVQVIKSFGQKAIAYPVSLRADHLKLGDKIEIPTAIKPYPLKFQFESTGQCAPVVIAESN